MADSTACQQAKTMTALLQKKLADLEAQKDDPRYAGPARSLYVEQMQLLQEQLTAAVAHEREVCAPSYTGPTQGTLIPKYMVLAVVYAPPGTSGGKGSSAVDYGTGSTLGTSVSTSSSYKNQLSLSVSAEGGFFGSGVTASVGFGTSVDQTDKNTVDFKKSEKVDIKVPGPASDGINHDEDRIYLWLNPKIDVSVVGATGTWTLGIDGPAQDEQFVFVGWLKNPQTMPADVAARLAARGITPSDYAAILAVDPLAMGQTVLDPNRFYETPTTFPYEPPLSSGDASSTETFSLTSESTQTQVSTTTSTISVSVGVTVKAGVAGFAQVTLKVSDKFTWTHSSSESDSQGTTQSASVAIGQPSFGYTGPTDIAVYWDRIFETFAFAPVPSTAERLVVGTVTDASKKPLAGQELVVTLAGRKHRTFTDARGQYRIFGALPAAPTQAEIRVGTTQKEVMLGRSTATVDLEAHALPLPRLDIAHDLVRPR